MMNFVKGRTGSPLSFNAFRTCSPPSGQYSEEMISQPFLWSSFSQSQSTTVMPAFLQASATSLRARRMGGWGVTTPSHHWTAIFRGLVKVTGVQGLKVTEGSSRHGSLARAAFIMISRLSRSVVMGPGVDIIASLPDMWPRIPREVRRLFVGLSIVRNSSRGFCYFLYILESVDAAVSAWATNAASDVSTDTLLALE